MANDNKCLDLATIEVEGVSMDEYPKFCNAYVSAAKWTDGTKLTDEELEEINNNMSQSVYEEVQDRCMDDWASYGDYLYDCYKEGM